MIKKYEWNAIQTAHDMGASWRDLRANFGVSFRALEKAKLRGDFVSRNITTATALAKAQGKGKDQVHSIESRRQTSERQSLQNSGGRCKWFVVSEQRVQGTWERNLALKFDDHNISWKKVGRSSNDVWKYIADGVERSYTPDFYLPERNLFLEIKGFWWGNDKEKMKLVAEQHTDKKLLIIERDDYERLLKDDFTLLNDGV